MRWNTVYSPQNHSDSDDLWDAIDPSHGFVAVDREWAAKQQWPVTMYLPSDHSKGVYLLEAYHQLHCLVSLRHVCSGSRLISPSESFEKRSGRPWSKGRIRGLRRLIQITALMHCVKWAFRLNHKDMMLTSNSR